VLLVRGAREVLHRELLEPVRRPRGRDLQLLALERRPRRRRLEHHRRADERDLLEAAVAMRGDGGVARGRDDALVGGEEVVGVRVEVGDPPDHRRAGDQVIGVACELGEHRHVARVGFDEAVVRVVAVRLRHRAVLRMVVDADHAVPAPQQLFHHVAADEPRRPREQDGAGAHR
jgi:hypothetical protein